MYFIVNTALFLDVSAAPFCQQLGIVVNEAKTLLVLTLGVPKSLLIESDDGHKSLIHIDTMHV